MTKQNYTIVAVERTLQVLLQLAKDQRPTGITELSESLGFSKVAVFRMISTLMEYDFIVQDSTTSLYELGPSVLKLTERFQFRNSLVTLSLPYLEELAAATKEVANIGVIQNGKVLVLKSVLGRPKSRFTLHLGPEADIHSSSLGKAILSDKSRDEITIILGKQPFHRYTKNTITSIKDFLEDLENAKETNIFLDDEETEEGLMCLGTPIKDWSNQSVAAISVSGFKSRLEEFGTEKIKDITLKIARQLSKRLSSGMNTTNQAS